MDTNLQAASIKSNLGRRKTDQPTMPKMLKAAVHKGYDIYPNHSLENGKILNGYETLAIWLADKKSVALDGYVGVFWEDVKDGLEQEFSRLALTVNWVDAADYLKTPNTIEKMVAPFLGSVGDVWGTKAKLSLGDFFEPTFKVTSNTDDKLTIVYGCGAQLIAPDATLVYFDLPKNELQLRMRAGSITNLGAAEAEHPNEMYKRFYFVDWVVLNEYKKSLLNKIEIFADGQWDNDVNWIKGADLMDGLKQLSKTSFRVKPWFEPGAWGGQWMKERIVGLSREVVNYAWSFELIVPENGLVFESDGNLLEVSFDMLMFAQRKAILGEQAEKFGDEFPIRFDFLDTWQGGSLSVQCHPSVPYIQKHFGETITQDETYYILDAEENANVYLGFQENINPEEFRAVLEKSKESGQKIEITDYVQSHAAKKHDLFLIPNGTVHSAGAGNMVLEISATPYIFTFKMYDWVRLGLDGKPRPINIEHAFENLRFEFKGDKVQEELISKPSLIKTGADWKIIHLPTHQDHFYDVHRLEFETKIMVDTNDSCHVLMLVEGESILVTVNGEKQLYHYAETFVVPADAISYTLQNKGTSEAKVIKAFLK
ncbi:mannose-6-phosphate isomerase class I [Pedobacter sp. UYP30]|uniref:class I mannose-6-phosphate isomerase n=1 Tax=Pedobacter sp. UYP30 TaxID=1756400 RepID=UPI003397E266